MSEVLTADVYVDEISLQHKIESLIDEKTMLAIHNLFAKMCDPYVPFLEGPLSQTVEVMPDYVRYIQPYAHYQYHGLEFNHTKDYHPLASAEWDQAMLRDRREEFESQVKDILVKRAKEIYG